MKTKLQFKQIPMCEILHDIPARHFTCRDEKWLFVSTEAPEKGDEYHFPIADFFKSPSATVDWIAHLSEKHWFNPEDFCTMMHRFRKETDSFGGLGQP